MKNFDQLKWNINNVLVPGELISYILDYSLHNRISDIFITEWMEVYLKKDWITSLNDIELPDEIKKQYVNNSITTDVFQAFMSALFSQQQDKDLFDEAMDDKKPFDYGISYQFNFERKKKNEDGEWYTIIEDSEYIRLRIVIVDTTEWRMVTIRPLLNLWLSYENLTSLKWAVAYWKKILGENIQSVHKSMLSSLEEMEVVSDYLLADIKRPSWLILATWTTWSWKSTLINSLLEKVLEDSNKHVLTLEDPIEYFPRKWKWKITQIEVWTHVKSFSEWIKLSKRENPDLVYIQEIRDKETALALMELIWSGVLVITTLHTGSAAETMDRLVWLMSTWNQDYVRSFISRQLISIINQKLIHVYSKDPDAKDKFITKWIQEYIKISPKTRHSIENNKFFDIESEILESNPPNRSLTKILWYLYNLNVITAQELSESVNTQSTLKSLFEEVKDNMPSWFETDFLSYFWVTNISDIYKTY